MNTKVYRDAGELITMDFPAQESIWGSVIQDREVVLVFAKRGSGKTFFSLELAHAIGANRRFLKFKGSRERRVLYADGEMGLRALKKRIEAIEQGSEVSIRGDMLRFLSFEDFKNGMPNLASPDGQKIYTEAADGCEVIVIDNLNCCSIPMTVRDDEIARWHRIQHWASEMKRRAKTVIFIHHPNKLGLMQSGTVQKENAADTIIHLQEPKTNITEPKGLRLELHFEKHRNFWGDDKEPMLIEMIDSECGRKWIWSHLNDARKLEINSMLQSGAKPKDIAEAFGISMFTARQAIRELEQEVAEPQTRNWVDTEEMF